MTDPRDRAWLSLLLQNPSPVTAVQPAAVPGLSGQAPVSTRCHGHPDLAQASFNLFSSSTGYSSGRGLLPFPEKHTLPSGQKDRRHSRPGWREPGATWGSGRCQGAEQDELKGPSQAKALQDSVIHSCREEGGQKVPCLPIPRTCHAQVPVGNSILPSPSR